MRSKAHEMPAPLSRSASSNKAQISRTALQHNVKIIHQKLQQYHSKNNAAQAKNSHKILAVIKADAYGHGMLAIANCLQAMPQYISGFAVADIAAAVALREHAIDLPIVCLSGFHDADELMLVLHYNLTAVLHDPSQLQILQHSSAKLQQYAESQRRLKLWLKVDTGMNRLGFAASDATRCYQQLVAMPYVDTNNMVLMTHLAAADMPRDKLTLEQYQVMEKLQARMQLPLSFANSAAIWDSTAPHPLASWARPGLALYGVSPLALQQSVQAGGGLQQVDGLSLQAVMRLSSQLIAVKHAAAGARVGYGGDFTCPCAMPYGVVSMGYADGFPRQLYKAAYVMLCGIKCPLIGRVSMDMLTIDLRPCLAAGTLPEVGEEILIWGDQLPIEELASAAATIPYCLLTGLGSRVERSMVDSF